MNSSGSDPVMSKKDFVDAMKSLRVTDTLLQDLIFNAFDTKRSGSISFQEFIRGLSVLTRGTPEEKLTFTFRMYDLNGDGFITRDEILQIVQSFYQLCGPLSSYTGKKFETPIQLVDEFFDELDEDSTGKISLEQYKEGAMKNQEIFQAMKLL